MLVVLVTGARGSAPASYLTRTQQYRRWTDRQAVWSVLDRVGLGTLIVGDASGVDFYARTWARFRQLGERLQVFEADWERHGRAAGILRNRAMATALDAYRQTGCDVRVIAFHDDILSSKGTQDMVRVAAEHEFRRRLVFHAGTPSSQLRKGQI